MTRKKGKLIHPEISYIISKMGHGDMLTICDSGLPIPKGVPRIDLAVTKGLPSFVETLDVILDELRVEEVILAKEMAEVSPPMYQAVMDRIKKVEEQENIKIQVVEVAHEQFKEMTKESAGIVRTGEYTPYGNIILKSGVVF